MKGKIISLCATLTALILEILPYGAVLNFADPDGEPLRRTFSYFDMTVFGYANFAPFIVALLTCALLVLAVLSFVLKKQMRTAVITLSALAAVLSLAPLLLGFNYFSVVGALIFCALTLAAIAAAIGSPKQ